MDSAVSYVPQGHTRNTLETTNAILVLWAIIILRQGAKVTRCACLVLKGTMEIQWGLITVKDVRTGTDVPLVLYKLHWLAHPFYPETPSLRYMRTITKK